MHINVQVQKYVDVLTKYNVEFDYILDIGARDAQQAVDFAIRYPNKIVYAFEPNPATAIICYEATKHLSNIVLEHIGLGKIDDRKIPFFIVPGNIGASSFKKPTYLPWGGLDQGYRMSDCGISTFKSWLDGEDLGKGVIWMDTQGSELDILEGFGDELENINAIFTEVSIEPCYEGACTYEQIDNFLLKDFVKVEEIYEWEREKNVIYVRKSCYNSSRPN